MGYPRYDAAIAKSRMKEQVSHIGITQHYASSQTPKNMLHIYALAKK